MTYQFNVEDAIKYGVEEAVILSNIKFWTAKNEANGKNLHDGRYWTYCSASGFSKLFPFWHQRKISRLLNKLVDQGAIITGNYNKMPYDRTLWYSPFHLTDSVNELTESVQPIPDSKTDSKKDNNILVISQCEEIYSLYPKKVGKGVAIKSIQKALTKISFEDLSRIVSIYCAKIAWKEKQFIPSPSTWFNQERWEDDQSEWENPSVTAKRNTQKSILD